MTRLQTSYCHRGGEPPLLGATIPEQFVSIVKRFPQREADPRARLPVARAIHPGQNGPVENIGGRS